MRYNETKRFKPGDRVIYSGYDGVIRQLYIDGPIEAARMYEVLVPGGCICVTGSDLQPRQTYSMSFDE